MNRTAFYASLKRRNSGVFGTSLSQRQVDGTEALLDALDVFPLDHAAHVLAECYHETGGGMFPVKETVYRNSKELEPSDAKVIARLDRAWAKGQLKWVKEPYWRDGWFGRGQIQITHKRNYEKAAKLTGKDLVKFPFMALEPHISAQIAAAGCRTGMFTGKRLSDFDGVPYDHHNARAIVNGDKKSVGPDIVKYAEAFSVALKAADWDVQPVADPAPDPAEEKPRVNGLALLFRSIFEALKGMRA